MLCVCCAGRPGGWPGNGADSAGYGRNAPAAYSAAYVGPDGKLHKAPRTYASEHDAEGWLAGERRKIDLGTWGAVERSEAVTLRAYADKWIEQRSCGPAPASTTSRCWSG